MDEAALKAMFEKENVDAVIHCAALKSVGESVQKPLEYYRNNITGTLTLMDVMKQTSVKNIDKFESTDYVRGDSVYELPLFLFKFNLSVESEIPLFYAYIQTFCFLWNPAHLLQIGSLLTN